MHSLSFVVEMVQVFLPSDRAEATKSYLRNPLITLQLEHVQLGLNRIS